MLKLVTILSFILLSVSGHSLSARAACFDISKSEPRELKGLLVQVIFAGPPDYDDVLGEGSESGFILRLAAPICITEDETPYSTNQFDEVELVGTETTAHLMASLVETNVHVTLGNLTAATFRFHHRPLVAAVTQIRPLEESTMIQLTSEATVKAFYWALTNGNGEYASGLVVPEKRENGPLSASQITKFYGSLVERLELIDLESMGSDEHLVRYKFVGDSGKCSGRAVVRTVARDRRNYILSIRALDGC